MKIVIDIKVFDEEEEYQPKHAKREELDLDTILKLIDLLSEDEDEEE